MGRIDHDSPSSRRTIGLRWGFVARVPSRTWRTHVILSTMRALAAKGFMVAPFVGDEILTSWRSRRRPPTMTDLDAIEGLLESTTQVGDLNYGIKTGSRADLDVLTIEDPLGSEEHTAFCKEFLRGGDDGDVYMVRDGRMEIVYRHMPYLEPGTFTIRAGPKIKVTLTNGAGYVLGPGSRTAGGAITIHGPGVREGVRFVENVMALRRRKMMAPSLGFRVFIPGLFSGQEKPPPDFESAFIESHRERTGIEALPPWWPWD